jgi:hypothetical protein
MLRAPPRVAYREIYLDLCARMRAPRVAYREIYLDFFARVGASSLFRSQLQLQLFCEPAEQVRSDSTSLIEVLPRPPNWSITGLQFLAL